MINEKLINLLDNTTQLSNIKSDYTYDGITVPRVTEIISKCIHADSLMGWANHLGFKRQSYKSVVQLAADIGSQCHETIDLFLDNNANFEPDYDMRTESRYAYESFLKWWNDIHINGNNVRVIYHEKPIVCKYFGGTLDGLYEINGKTYLVDYKTSNHITFRYCLQLAAYRYILREVYNINIDGCIILQLSKNCIGYNEHVLDLSIPEQAKYFNDCELAFLSIVFSYYNINNVENNYKILGWGK